MTFFSSWPTWVKLTFVLGCAICVVLVYATGVRYSNKKKLKKHAVRIATEIAERGEMTEAVRRSEEVAFGIRAIERGCIVEGVWNSKATTPLQTPTSSKASSPVLKAAKNRLKRHKRDSSLSNVSHVDIPEPALVTSNSTERVAGLPNTPLESVGTTLHNQIASGTVGTEHEMSANDLLADGPGPALYSDRPLTATSCGLLPSGPGPHMEPSWTSNAEGLNEQLHPSDSATQISDTYRDISRSVNQPSGTQCLSNDTTMQPQSSQLRKMPLSRGLETLEYMNAHRRCHAAETGQLIPRVRRKPSSGEFITGLNTSTFETGKDHSSTRSVSWPMSNTDSCNNGTTPATPPLPYNLEDLPICILAKHLPLPPLRHVASDSPEDPLRLRDDGPSIQSERASLIENRPRRQPNPSSLCIKSRVATSKTCPSSWTDRLQEQLEDVQTVQQKSARFPLTDAVLSHHNKTARKINSGFEILPSGTLTMPTPVREWGDAVSGLADTSNEVRVSRKLQKRDRSSSRSRRSSFELGRRIDENTE